MDRWIIRPATEQDHTDIARAETDKGPEPVSVTEIRDWDRARRKDTEFPSKWFVVVDTSAGQAEGGNAFLGWGEQGRDSWLAPDERYVYVAVPIPNRGKGVGTFMLNYLEELAIRDRPPALTSWVRGHDPESMKWAETRGYAVHRRRTEGLLDLTHFDVSRFRNEVERVRSTSVEIVLVLDRQMDPYLRQMYEVDIQTAPEVPFRSPEAAAPSFENWVLEYTGTSAHVIVALALQGGQVVGLSNVYMPVMEGQSAGIGYTGVLRTYRGKGIAFALKVLAAGEAAKAGAKQIRTHNDPDNPAILRLNEKMGFREVPGPVIVKKALPSLSTATR